MMPQAKKSDFRLTVLAITKMIYSSKKLDKHGILAMRNPTQILSCSQPIKFPLIANGNGTLNLPARQNHP